MEKESCPRCGWLLPDSATACPNCGCILNKGNGVPFIFERRNELSKFDVKIYIDNLLIGYLKAGQTCNYFVSPGKHTIKIVKQKKGKKSFFNKSKSGTSTIEVEKGCKKIVVYIGIIKRSFVYKINTEICPFKIV